MNRQKGFGAIAAIVILVILAVLAAAIVSLSTTQQITSAQDVMSAKAWQAARSGNEWGLYKALKTGSCIAAPGSTIDLSADTGFHVTVTCDSWTYNEGETVPGTARLVTVYRITAVACPAAACPASNASVAGVGYVERTRVVLATN
jgi:MSHA biogenesis protein MshP